MKKWMICLLTVLIVLGGRVYAQESLVKAVSADGWTAETDGSVIGINEEGGAQIVLLEYEKPLEIPTVLLVADYNMDGKDDLVALKNMGTVNSYYMLWLRTEEGGFEACPAFEEISAPRINANTGRIEGFERIDAAKYRESRFKWNGNELFLSGVREIEYGTDERVCVIDRWFEEGGTLTIEYEMDFAEWERADLIEERAEMLSGKMRSEYGVETETIFRGLEEMNEGRYLVYEVRSGYETISVIYAALGEKAEIMLDDKMDGQVNLRKVEIAD